MTHSLRRTNLALDLAAGLVVALSVLFALFPLVWTALTSLKAEEDIVTRTLQ